MDLVHDVCEPRKVNGQAIVLRESSSGYDVLLQLRSMSMKVMPGHLAALGGCRDRTDSDSRETALREVVEECGLVAKCVSVGPLKFAEGAKCDWYVMVLREPSFEKAKSRWECGDIKSVKELLPKSFQVADCYGHAWIPTSDMGQIDGKMALMGGAMASKTGLETRSTRNSVGNQLPRAARSSAASCKTPGRASRRAFESGRSSWRCGMKVSLSCERG